MSDFQVNGETYRAAKLPAIRAMHVTRRLAPVLSRLGPVVDFLQLDAPEDRATALQAIVGKVVPAIVAVMADMKDDDVEYIINNCMAVVTRNQGGVWVKVWNASAGRSQFDDLELPGILQITYNVLQENLLPFFSGLPSTSPPSPVPPSIG